MTEPEKYYNASQALEKAKEAGLNITLPTLIVWIEKNDLGFQPGGNNAKWFINREKFDEFIKLKEVL